MQLVLNKVNESTHMHEDTKKGSITPWWKDSVYAPITEIAKFK